MTNVKTSVSGFWNTMLYFNGTTSKLHTEKYCSYKLITVPKQIGAASKNHTNQPIFLFKFNDRDKLMIPLASSVIFIYNGKFITHRQSCARNNKNTEKNYIVFPHMVMENYSTT